MGLTGDPRGSGGGLPGPPSPADPRPLWVQAQHTRVHGAPLLLRCRRVPAIWTPCLPGSLVARRSTCPVLGGPCWRRPMDLASRTPGGRGPQSLPCHPLFPLTWDPCLACSGWLGSASQKSCWTRRARTTSGVCLTPCPQGSPHPAQTLLGDLEPGPRRARDGVRSPPGRSSGSRARVNFCVPGGPREPPQARVRPSEMHPQCTAWEVLLLVVRLCV